MDVTDLSDLKARALADLAVRVGTDPAALTRWTGRIWALALAGAAWMAERFGLSILRQVDPQTASGAYLDLIGGLFSVSRSGDTDADYRARILAQLSAVPAAATVADYERWVKEAYSRATRVWVMPEGYGPSTVRIWFSAAGTGTSIVPGAGAITTVQNYINARRSVASRPVVSGPATRAVALRIVPHPNTRPVQDQIRTELEGMFGRRRGPSVTIYNSEIRDAISQADGEEYHQLLDVDGDGTGLSNLVASADEVLCVGAITWV